MIIKDYTKDNNKSAYRGLDPAPGGVVFHQQPSALLREACSPVGPPHQRGSQFNRHAHDN